MSSIKKMIEEEKTPKYTKAEQMWDYMYSEDVAKALYLIAEKGKSTRPNIKLGICGEHGGDPASVEFCHRVGLTYVSCSPFRVPIARLAAAQAAIKEHQK